MYWFKITHIKRISLYKYALILPALLVFASSMIVVFPMQQQNLLGNFFSFHYLTWSPSNISMVDRQQARMLAVTIHVWKNSHLVLARYLKILTTYWRISSPKYSQKNSLFSTNKLLISSRVPWKSPWLKSPPNKLGPDSLAPIAKRGMGGGVSGGVKSGKNMYKIKRFEMSW